MTLDPDPLTVPEDEPVAPLPARRDARLILAAFAAMFLIGVIAWERRLVENRVPAAVR